MAGNINEIAAKRLSIRCFIRILILGIYHYGKYSNFFNATQQNLWQNVEFQVGGNTILGHISGFLRNFAVLEPE